MPEPSSVAPNGRNPTGTFAPGNTFAKGNPHAAKVNKLRNGLLQGVSVAEIRRVVKRLLDTAKNGDVSATRLLFDRLLGPPLSLDIEERVRALEQRAEEYQRHVSQD